MSLFGKKTAAVSPQKPVTGVTANQSVYGAILPISIGPNRVPMSLVGLWDFLATTTKTPGTSVGKGIGGGAAPASTTTTYSTAFQAALCLGPVDHIDAIYTSSGRIPATFVSTNFTVPGGGGHLDITDNGFRGDKGVGVNTAFSQTSTDFGASTSNTLSGTYLVPMVAGAVSAPGVYVVTTPSAGVTRYTFNAADAGASVVINYTSNLSVVTLNAEIVIPGTATYSVPDPTNYVGNSTAQYVVSGVNLVVGSTASAGHYTADSSGNFAFNAADIGQEIIITYQSKDPNTDAATVFDYSFANGSATQSPWSYLSGRHVTDAFSHPFVALIQSSDLSLGTSASMPQLSFETVSTTYMAGAGILGANPADVIAAILCDSVWGCGFDPALLGDWSNARNFWQANGFFISLYEDSQTTAQNVIASILDAGQGAFYWNNGLLCIAVYGDTAAAGNGAIYLPDTQPIVEFSVDDTVAAGGAEPIKIDTAPEQNIFNRVKVEFLNAANDYNTEVIMEDDPASISLHGLYEEGQQQWDFIRSVSVAQWAANLRLRRYTNIRDTYSYTVTTRYRHLLAPMKLVTVTWSALGWSQKPMRITKIEESHAGLKLTLEEFPYGVAKATLYPKQTPQAINANPALINPGNTNIVALEIPDAMNGFAGRTVRLYASPETPNNWGGAEIYGSDDNIEFEPLGKIESPVVIGTLGSTMTVGSGDPDTQSITVAVTNGLPILPATASDFVNKLSLLAIVDVAGTFEIVAYSNATLTGINTYSVDTFHRALFGTTRASHVSGATIVELGEIFVEFQYPSSRDGTAKYLKACSFNKMQGRMQDFGSVGSVSLTLSGAHIGFFNLNTGQLYGLTQVPDDATYKKTTINQIQYIDPVTGNIPASTPFNPQLSLVAGQSIPFTKAPETTTTLGLSWGTQTLFLSDGSSFTLNAGSHTFSGLTSNTQYFNYMYLTVSAGVGTMNFIQTTSPSSVSAVQSAFDGRYPLGVVVDSTTASGTGTGGTIDPGGTCPHEDEPVYVRRNGVESIIAAKDVRDGDEIKGYSFAQCADVWRRVSHIQHSRSTLWYRVNGHLCSPCEQVYVNGAWWDAWQAPVSDADKTTVEDKQISFIKRLVNVFKGGAPKPDAKSNRVRNIPGWRIGIVVEAEVLHKQTAATGGVEVFIVTHCESNYYLASSTPLLIHNGQVIPRS